jgi:hypothetical protein
MSVMPVPRLSQASLFPTKETPMKHELCNMNDR